jgi:hypothetical protein
MKATATPEMPILLDLLHLNLEIETIESAAIKIMQTDRNVCSTKPLIYSI